MGGRTLVQAGIAIAIAGFAGAVLVGAWRLRATLAGLLALLALVGAGAAGILATSGGETGAFLAISGALSAIAAVLLAIGHRMEHLLEDQDERCRFAVRQTVEKGKDAVGPGDEG